MSKFIFNIRWLIYVSSFALLVLLCVLTFDEDVLISIIGIIIGLFFILVYLFFIPNSYRISETSLTVYYGFGLKTEAMWHELRTVQDHCDTRTPWLREYHIGYFKTKFPFWEMALMPKTKRTTQLIERYYRRKIEKYG